MTAVSISRVHFPVTTLGPGRRVGVWFQGCSIRCPSCISADTWTPGRGMTTVDAVLDTLALWARGAEGLTVSGGEPFEQSEALSALLRGWRQLSPGGVLAFTGFELDAVAPWLAANPGLIDAVMTGPYDRSAPQTMALRGSDNQKLHVMSALGAQFSAFDRPATIEDRRLDVMFDAEGGAWFAGIPAHGDFQRFRQGLKAEGHRVILSDQVGPSR
ncbi:MAG: radical SAM protein [Mesorhizobium sp.]|nr:MAG: radical SAM protein [Mesorhizobium sp.]